MADQRKRHKLQLRAEPTHHRTSLQVSGETYQPHTLSSLGPTLRRGRSPRAGDGPEEHRKLKNGGLQQQQVQVKVFKLCI